MSSGAVPAEAGGSLGGITETEKNWLYAAAIVIGSVALFAVVYGVEMGVGRWDSRIRLVGNPSEAAMRYLGISHFLLATLYLATSRRMRKPRSWASLGAWLAVGGALCLGYARLKAANALLASLFFFAYFLVHSLRDDVFFYFAYGDAPGKQSEPLRDLLRWIPWLFFGLAATVAAALLALGAIRFEWLSGLLEGVPQPLRWALGSLAPALLVVAVLKVREHWGEAHPGDLVPFLRANRPILLVFAATVLILVGGKGFAIVTLHVAAWYVFSLSQMRSRAATAPEPRRWSWRWLRDTPSGFRLLHVGSALLLVAAGTVWAYGFRNDSELAVFRLLLDPNAFPYWTILHVTASFSN